MRSTIRTYQKRGGLGLSFLLKGLELLLDWQKRNLLGCALRCGIRNSTSPLASQPAGMPVDLIALFLVPAPVGSMLSGHPTRVSVNAAPRVGLPPTVAAADGPRQACSSLHLPPATRVGLPSAAPRTGSHGPLLGVLPRTPVTIVGLPKPVSVVAPGPVFPGDAGADVWTVQATTDTTVASMLDGLSGQAAQVAWRLRDAQGRIFAPHDALSAGTSVQVDVAGPPSTAMVLAKVTVPRGGASCRCRFPMRSGGLFLLDWDPG